MVIQVIAEAELAVILDIPVLALVVIRVILAPVGTQAIVEVVSVVILVTQALVDTRAIAEVELVDIRVILVRALVVILVILA